MRVPKPGLQCHGLPEARREIKGGGMHGWGGFVPRFLRVRGLLRLDKRGRTQRKRRDAEGFRASLEGGVPLRPARGPVTRGPWPVMPATRTAFRAMPS